MDISAVNINFNAVNRGAFTSSSDEPEAPEQANARVRQGRNGVSAEAQLNLIPPALESEGLVQDQGRTELKHHIPHGRINLRV